MEDLQLAKKILIEENLALVVVKNKQIIYKSKDKGIKPMYILATEMRHLSKGASIADKVIGKGAALLCSYLEINKVYSSLISKAGMEILEKEHIYYTFEKTCDYIKNMDGTDYCPIEKISLDVVDPVELLEKLNLFFSKNKK